MKRAIKQCWHAPSVRHICLENEAKRYLPKHLARKELFALLDRETVPLNGRVRISYINLCDFSFHMWPNVLFFIASSSSSIIFLFVGDKFTKILCCSFYSEQWSSSSHWRNLHTVFTDYTGWFSTSEDTDQVSSLNIWYQQEAPLLKKKKNPLFHIFGTPFLVHMTQEEASVPKIQREEHNHLSKTCHGFTCFKLTTTTMTKK